MKRCLMLIAILFLVLLIPNYTYAADIQLKENISSSTVKALDLGEWINNLVSQILGKHVDEEIVKLTDSTLPKTQGEIKAQSMKTQEESKDKEAETNKNALSKSIGGYEIASAITSGNNNKPVERNVVQQFLDGIFDPNGEAQKGNQAATEFLSSQLPIGQGEKIISYYNTSNESKYLAQNNSESNTLGLFGQNDAMAHSLPVIKCANLPLSKDNKDCPYMAPLLSPTPTITPTPSTELMPTINPITGMVYYSQRDPLYAEYPPPPPNDRCTIKLAGCGPTSVSMILSSFVTPDGNDPISVIQKYYNNKVGGVDANGDCTGTMIDDARKTLRSNGLQVSGYIFNYSGGNDVSQPQEKVISDIRNYLAGGWTIFANARIFGYGHYFWIVKVDDNNIIYAMDPWYGYGKPNPINMTVLNPKYRLAFGVKK
jgi:hypothetical protein